MGSEVIIEVDQLSKRYVIGRDERHDTLRDRLAHMLASFGRHGRAGGGEEFWALRDVSFTVKRGEVLGVIGRNGAGKSTLLKILSRITEPTAGRIRLRGRVASLLEVGTGFHPELTGRENVFLNGAILGMSRAEIRARFDEIVAFAEIDRFLDTPVKRYSSGMYVRLAFAVAAHLDPEILIIDEVLAVGDAEFQKKCLGKMGSFAQSGRTIFFVSHNLNAIRQLTTTCLYLAGGRVAASGSPRKVLDAYARAGREGSDPGQGTHSAILSARLVDAGGLELASVHGEGGLFLELTIRTSGHPRLTVECFLTDLEGTRLGLLSPGHYHGWALPPTAGTYRCRFPVALPALASGKYGFDACTLIHGSGIDHFVSDAVVIDCSARLDFPAKWELRKEYNAGYLVLDAGLPQIDASL